MEQYTQGNYTSKMGQYNKENNISIMEQCIHDGTIYPWRDNITIIGQYIQDCHACHLWIKLGLCILRMLIITELSIVCANVCWNIHVWYVCAFVYVSVCVLVHLFINNMHTPHLPVSMKVMAVYPYNEFASVIYVQSTLGIMGFWRFSLPLCVLIIYVDRVE